jgi:ectoine hydroxylase-related dioxygenase (phytanoyl-CoA dioxygenase family)
MNADPLREISEEDVRLYDEDGVVLLKGMFDEAWLKHLSEQIEVDIANPGPVDAELEEDGQPGRFFFDTFMWTYNAAFKQFVFESPAAIIAARMMLANKVNIFYDQLLIKEPGTVKRTPWHHDMPYWPLVGWQVCTIWLALDPVTKKTVQSSTFVVRTNGGSSSIQRPLPAAIVMSKACLRCPILRRCGTRYN